MQNLFLQNIIINIDKPIGMSSTRVLVAIKGITGAKKAGHFGTLDPFASGVLPIALNNATVASNYIMADKKKYHFRIIWGEFRDTDDINGEVERTSINRPKIDEILSILPEFVGKIKQVPSKFSAIRINGKKAYKLARKGVEFEIKEREIEVDSLNLITSNDEFGEFEVECGKGTYVRSLGRDICKKLGVCGYLGSLRRLKVGKLLIESSISLDKLKDVSNLGANLTSFGGSLLFLRDALDFMSEITLNNSDLVKFRHGQFIDIGGNFLQEDSTKEALRVISGNELVGLAYISNNLLKPISVFN